MARINQATSAPPSTKKMPGLGRSTPFFLLQPILRKIVNRIGEDNPDMFGRLGPHYQATFVIDPSNTPFALVLRPDPDNLMLLASTRRSLPSYEARITGKFLDLLMLVDGDLDGDALFFSRDLTISGNTEAVVCLRNALDDVDGSIAEKVADMFGFVGRKTLAALRSAAHRKASHKEISNEPT